MTLEEFKLSLGKTGEKMSESELKSLMATMDFLSDQWLDIQERKIFDGLTIDELLNQ